MEDIQSGETSTIQGIRDYLDDTYKLFEEAEVPDNKSDPDWKYTWKYLYQYEKLYDQLLDLIDDYL